MGSSSSKYKFDGGINIQLDNSSYFDSQDVSGMIHLSLNAFMSPASLFIIFKGKEHFS